MKDTQFKKTWGKPLLIGLITIFGLLSALLGVGIWHVFSWITMLIPLLIIAWFWLMPSGGRK